MKGMGPERWLLLAVTVLAAALRLPTLATKSMWVDEGLTALCAESFAFAFEQCWTVGVNTPATIFMTVLPYGWWPGEFGLRLIPALFGIAAVPAIYGLVRQWSNTAGATSAALFLATSPLHLHHSQDARTYSVMIFCSIVSVLLLGRLYEQWQKEIERTALLATAAFYVLVTLLGLYNHYHAVLLLGAQVLWVGAMLLRSKTRARRQAILYSVLLFLSVVIGFAPWFPPVMRLAGEKWVRASVTQTPVDAVEGRAVTGGPESRFAPGEVVGETLQRLVSKWTQGEVPPPGDRRWVWFLQLGLAVVGAYVLVKTDRPRALLLGLIFTTGLVYVVVAAAPLLLYSRVYLYVRHVAFAFPIFLALQGTAVGFLWSKRRMVAALALASYLYSVAPALLFYYQVNKQDWRGATEFLLANASNGDQVVVDCADWAMLAYLQRNGFRLTYDRARSFEVYGEERTLSFINPVVPYDPAKPLWWVHAESSSAPAEILDPRHLQYRSDWGYLGGSIEIYRHGPQP